MLAPLPLGLTNVSKKVEEGAIAKGKKDVAAQIAKQYADSQRRMNALNLVDQRVAARGPLPGPVRLPPQPNMLTSVAAPAVAPSDNDPNRMYTPMGKSPKLTPQDINGTPPPANMAQGVGGPQGGPPPEDEVAAIEAELKRREEIQALEQELARRGGQQAPQAAPEAPLNTDAMINEAVAQIPGGYKAWQEKNNPAPAGQHYERDPLAKGEKYYLAPDQPQGKPQEFGGNNSLELGVPFTSLRGSIPLGKRDDPTNVQIADILDQGVAGIMDLATGQKDQSVKPLLKDVPFVGDVGSSNDPVGAFARALGEPILKVPGATLRNPAQAAMDYLPPNQAATAYNQTQNALSQAMQGNWAQAGESGLNALNSGVNAAIGFAGLKGGGAPKGPPRPSLSLKEAQRAAASGVPPMPPKPAVREPTVREAGKTLAAELVPGRKIRPQAYEGIANVLVNSGVPRNRVASGFARVVQGLKTLPDGVANREATVAQLFKREFGEEFPQVLDSIDAHLRGAALSLKPGDIRPGIINSVATEMRGSQVPFLQESGRRNLGENGLFAKEGQALAEMERLVEEGYKPLLAKPIGIKGQLAIQEVLQDPATAQYLKALEQDALEQGTTVGKMIATNPVAAAHWVQSKARAVAEANPDLRRTATMRREKILNVLEENVPGYRETRLKYGDQYGAADSVGLGDNFLAVGRNEYKLEKLLETYEGLSETQKPVGLASIWNAINTKIRGTQAKPGTPARTADIATIGTIDALNRLGPRGKAFADDLMAVADENDFLTSITQRAKSQTGSNMQAIKEGDRLATKAGALVPDSLGTDMIAMGTGVTHAPIMSALKAVPEAINGLRKPRLSTREDMTRILMARPKTTNKLTPPEPPKGPPTGSGPKGGGQLANAEKILSDPRVASQLTPEQFQPLYDTIAAQMQKLQSKMIDDPLTGRKVSYANTQAGSNEIQRLNGLLLNYMKTPDGGMDFGKVFKRAEAADPDRTMRVQAGRAANDLEDGVTTSDAIDMTPDGYERTAEFGSATIKYSVNPDKTISLEVIEVPQSARGKGEAGAALDKLLAEADAKGLTVYVEPRPIPSAAGARSSRVGDEITVYRTDVERGAFEPQKVSEYQTPVISMAEERWGAHHRDLRAGEGKTYELRLNRDKFFDVDEGFRKQYQTPEWASILNRLNIKPTRKGYGWNDAAADIQKRDGVSWNEATAKVEKAVREEGFQGFVAYRPEHGNVYSAFDNASISRSAPASSPANGLTKPQLEQFYAKRGFTKQAGGTGMVRSPNGPKSPPVKSGFGPSFSPKMSEQTRTKTLLQELARPNEPQRISDLLAGSPVSVTRDEAKEMLDLIRTHLRPEDPYEYGKGFGFTLDDLRADPSIAEGFLDYDPQKLAQFQAVLGTIRDPAKSGSSNLLAGATGLGGLGLLSAVTTMQKDEKKKPR